jgi:glycerol uptake facilitator-like aquaporin
VFTKCKELGVLMVLFGEFCGAVLMVLFGEFCGASLDKRLEFWEVAKRPTSLNFFVVSGSR